MDTQQIHSLYSDHHSWLKDWFRLRLGCSFQAEDLAHDTFVRILRRRDQLRDQPLQQPRAFLRVIAKGLLIDQIRRREVEQAFLETLASQPEPTLISEEERALMLETLQTIDALLDALHPAVRKAFLLSQLDGLTYAKIADQMDVSLRTIKRYMQQAFSQCLTALL